MSEHKGRKGARKKYKEPDHQWNGSDVNIKLFCAKWGCNNYTKGKLGYNGSYVDECGAHADLRNQVWYCSKHDGEIK